MEGWAWRGLESLLRNKCQRSPLTPYHIAGVVTSFQKTKVTKISTETALHKWYRKSNISLSKKFAMLNAPKFGPFFSSRSAARDFFARPERASLWQQSNFIIGPPKIYLGNFSWAGERRFQELNYAALYCYCNVCDAIKAQTRSLVLIEQSNHFSFMSINEFLYNETWKICLLFVFWELFFLHEKLLTK